MNNSTARRKVAVVGTVGIPAAYGGFETLVEYLVTALGDDFEMHVYCSSKRNESKPSLYRGAHLHYVRLDANGISSIPYDVLSMVHANRYADIILVLGVSGCAFLPLLRFFSPVRIILNVDGMEWHREKWSKLAKWFLRTSEGLGVRYSNEVVADNAVIQKYLDKRYGSAAVCIAYGGDHASHVTFGREDLDAFPFLNSEYAVKVCRIEPENNVHVVLEAFAQLHNQNIVVIGNWQSSTYGKGLYRKHFGSDNICLLNPIYDSVHLNRIRSNATIYVHGHSAGGTNPSLVEAMWLGLPVFAYDVGYNRETTENKAIYFGEAGSLTRLINGMTEENLQSVAREMREIAERRYTWNHISRQYALLFVGTD